MINNFYKYVDNFDLNNEKVLGKKKHSVRVQEISIELAKSLDLSDEEIEVAGIIGLLHDIGRFIQIRDYNTFNDNKSIDHALLGVKILFEDNLIESFCKDKNYYSIIKKAIFYHNKYSLPNNLDKKTLMFCKIIRDADKLDIFQIKYDENIDDKNKEISEKVLMAFLNEELVLTKDLEMPGDYIMFYISFIFDINYDYSFNQIVEKNYMNSFIEKLSVDNIEQIKTKVDEYIRKRIS
ncbi:MAG: HD domain-containing protein [Bacilli bacterium]|nr:HD domain-containing protein [Bacilli bacterium]